MIKGVNKQVVEISDTGNEFFEKAIFFVRPEYSGLGEGKLREKAQSAIDKTAVPPRGKHMRRAGRLKPVIGLLLAAAGGGTLTAAVLLLIK